jgi:DNA-binding response OmpR family regulator
MVIEDEPMVRMGLQLILEGWDCAVFSAGSGEEALATSEREDWCFDAIIADHRLGAGMSGTQSAAEIRKRAGRPIPTLIVTGDTAPERIEEIHASGFEIMHKPVSPKELARRMAYILRGGMNARVP